MRGRPYVFAVGGALAAAALALLPQAALAHGIVGRADLPIPKEMFFAAAGVVLVVSFVLAGVLWTTPHLQDPDGRRLARISPMLATTVEALGGALGVATFIAVVYSGLAGVDSPTANLAPTIVYVIFWVGLVVVSFLFGDVFRLLNPWLATARLVSLIARRLRPRGEVPEAVPYPSWLGYWPVALGLLAFAWVELVWSDGDVPASLAILALVYAGFQLLGMSLFGIERWSDRGDAFGVYFGFVARLSPLRWARDGLYLRRPTAGTTGIELAPGLVAVLCVVIGSTAFDGGSEGPAWTSIAPDIQRWIAGLGFSLETALELTFTLGLVFCVLAVAGIYGLGVAGMRLVRGLRLGAGLGRSFAHTLVPIGCAYVIAHYFSLLAFQGQAVGYLISDPLGDGSNLLGTAEATIDYTWVSATAIWWVQVGTLVVGHVAALLLAHDRALVRWPSVSKALLSQLFMLVVMVAFTVLGLWLLSASNQ